MRGNAEDKKVGIIWETGSRKSYSRGQNDHQLSSLVQGDSKEIDSVVSTVEVLDDSVDGWSSSVGGSLDLSLDDQPLSRLRPRPCLLQLQQRATDTIDVALLHATRALLCRQGR